MVEKKKKDRLDLFLKERYPHLSRARIQSLILQRKVQVNGVTVDKAGTLVSFDSSINIDIDEPKYVSRAGEKLERALDYFDVAIEGLVVLDAGISTGGFTDCLLQRGAKRVYGVDVGYGDVHEKIRKDPRVVLLERTNLRYLKSLPEQVDFVTLDLAFISILKVMPAIIKLIKPEGKIIALIKPQFEASPEDVGSGGVVRDKKVHKKIIECIRDEMKKFGYEMTDIIESPIRGAKKGNLEFLALFVPTGSS